MIRLVAIILITLSLALWAGCQRDKEPPPRMVAGGAGVYPPVHSVLKDLDSEFVKSAADAGSVSIDGDDFGETGYVAEGGEGGTEFDDSSAEALVDAYLAMLAAGRFDQWVDFMVPEQREIIGILAELSEVSRELWRVMKEKFPSSNLAYLPMDPGRKTSFTVLSVESVDDRRALVKLKNKLTNKTVEINVVLIDEGWRIDDSSTTQMVSSGQGLTMMRSQIDSLRDVITRVENDEFANTQAVFTEMGRLMTKQASGGAGGGADTGATTETPARADKSERKPKRESSRSEMDMRIDATPSLPGLAPRGR